MIIRLACAATLAVACAGCANESAIEPMRLGVHGDTASATANTPSTAGTAGTARPATRGAGPSHRSPDGKIKQTLGGKVLSAIALERVTGRKPDPRRFRELR